MLVIDDFHEAAAVDKRRDMRLRRARGNEMIIENSRPYSSIVHLNIEDILRNFQTTIGEVL